MEVDEGPSSSPSTSRGKKSPFDEAKSSFKKQIVTHPSRIVLVGFLCCTLVFVPILAIFVERYSIKDYPSHYVAELVHNQSIACQFPEVIAAKLRSTAITDDDSTVPSSTTSTLSMLTQYLPSVDSLYETGMGFLQSGMAQLKAATDKISPTNDITNTTNTNTTTPNTTISTPTTKEQPTQPEKEKPVEIPTISFDRTRLLKGITAIVTGSTSGLGKQIAGELYSMGAHVVVASRNRKKCRKTVKEIRKRYNDSVPAVVGRLEVGILDTSDLDSVASFAQHFLANHTQLHYLVNNAGIHYISMDDGAPMRNLSIPLVSPQGYDLAFATNYLGHFLLTELLLPLIAETSTFGAVINIASTFHYQSDGSMLKIPHKRTGSTNGNSGASLDLTGASSSSEESNSHGDGDNNSDQDPSASLDSSASTGAGGEGESDSSSVDATPTDDQVSVNSNSSSSNDTSSNNNNNSSTGTTETPSADNNRGMSSSSPPPSPPKNRWWSATGLLPDLGFMVFEGPSRPKGMDLDPDSLNHPHHPHHIASPQESQPIAARSDVNHKYRHRVLSYANNKLAQVLHAKELQRRLDENNVKVRTASVCPGFVATNIIPDDFFGRIASATAFSIDQGVLAPLCAMFDSTLEGGEFVGHFENHFSQLRWLQRVAAYFGLRDAMIYTGLVYVLGFQKTTYGKCRKEPSSHESHDTELARALFDWSKKEISGYLGVTVE